MTEEVKLRFTVAIDGAGNYCVRGNSWSIEHEKDSDAVVEELKRSIDGFGKIKSIRMEICLMVPADQLPESSGRVPAGLPS